MPAKGTIASKKKWYDLMPVIGYKLARVGVSDNAIIKELGITKMCWQKWQIIHPVLKAAVDMGRDEYRREDTLSGWVYKRLSPTLRDVWDKIEKWEEERNGVVKIEAMLADHGKVVRQQLFLYALCDCHFSPSYAMKKVNITKRELDKWICEDTEFAELVVEMEWHKGNFYESSLTALVAAGIPSAVIFANKTYNQSRGYKSATSLDVHHSGTVVHGVLDLAELMPYLSGENKQAVLAAIHKLEEDRVLANRTPTFLENVEKQVYDMAEESTKS